MNNDSYQKLPIFHLSEIIKLNQREKHMKGIIFGNFGAKNLGDEAILAGQLEELRKIPNLEITVVGRFPKEVNRLHHARSISLYDVPKVLQEMKKADFIIMGGGGLVSKLERGFIGLFYQLYSITLILAVAEMFKKKTYVWGIGIYDNASVITTTLAIQLFKNVTALSVRDKHSYDFLTSKNLPVKLYKDNSFLMQLLPEQEILNDSFFKKSYKTERKHVGISLLTPESKKDKKHLIKQLVTFIEENYKVCDFWFYSLDTHPSYFNDQKFGQILYDKAQEKVGKDLRFYMIPTDWHPQKFFSSFQLMDFFITMRLHASIFAYRNKIDFVGISYDKKCASFLTSIGREPLQVQHISWKRIQRELA